MLLYIGVTLRVHDLRAAVRVLGRPIKPKSRVEALGSRAYPKRFRI